MTRQLLREYIFCSLLERKSDEDYFALARKIFDGITRALTSGTMTPALQTKGRASLYFSKLKLDIPEELNDISLEVRVSKGDTGLDGEYEPLEMIITLRFSHKEFISLTGAQDMTQDVTGTFLKCLVAKRSTFFHEFRHAWDMLTPGRSNQSDFSFLTANAKNVDAHKAYFNSEGEMNAYITQTIEDVLSQFVKECDGEPTRTSAKEWVPNGSALHDRFLDATDEYLLKHVDKDKWIKRGAPRMATAWKRFVDGLSG